MQLAGRKIAAEQALESGKRVQHVASPTSISISMEVKQVEGTGRVWSQSIDFRYGPTTTDVVEVRVPPNRLAKLTLELRRLGLEFLKDVDAPHVEEACKWLEEEERRIEWIERK
jgi:hypothetical protein